MISRVLPLSLASAVRLALCGSLSLTLTVQSFGADPATTAAPPAPPAVPSARQDPTVAAPKAGNEKFFQMHESFLKRGKAGPCELVFLGDSITEGWAKAPAVWKEFYGKYQPANFGIGGDRCEHVLWRIDNGELDVIRPKVVVLMIGTNNSATNSAEQIAAADRKIVSEIKEKLPDTKVLLLAIFPRGPHKSPTGAADDGVARMKLINAVNAELAKLDDGKKVRFLNINDRFLVDGAIPMDVMPDQLHPSAKGYQIWAEAMQPTLEQMMK